MLKKIDNHLEDLLMVVLLCVMSLLIFVQVIMRYIFNNSLSWSEELARYLFPNEFVLIFALWGISSYCCFPPSSSKPPMSCL